MTLFGIKLDRERLPLWFLMLAIPMLPFIREAYPVFWHSLTVRLITVSCCWLYIMLYWVTSQNTAHLSKNILTALMAWLAASLASTVTSDIPWQGLVRWFEISSYLVFAIMLWSNLKTAPEFRTNLIASLMLMMLAIIFRFLYGWISVYDPVNHPWSIQLPFASNIRHIGYLISLSLPLAFPWLLSKTTQVKLFFIAYLCIAWGFLFWMGGRGSFIAVSLVCLFFSYRYPKTIPNTLLTIFTGLLLSQLFIVTDSSLNLFRLFDLGLQTQTADQISSGRLNIYIDSLKLWLNHGLLLGMGADYYRFSTPAIANQALVHPHSWIIQLALSFGLCGLVIVSYLVARLLKTTWHTLRSNNSNHYPAALSVASLLLAGLVDGIFYHSLAFFLSCIVIAISLPPSTSSTTVSLPRSIVLPLSVTTLAIYGFFGWSILCSQNATVTQQQLSLMGRMPVYISALNWIHNTPDPRRKTELAAAAAAHSDTPCRYAIYLPADQYPMKWCNIRNIQ